MLSKLFVTLTLVLSTLFANAQKSKTFQAINFNSINISNGIDLYLSQGNGEGVTVRSDDVEVLNEVIVEKNGTSLNIKFKDGFKLSNLFKGRNAKAYVSFKTLNALSCSGGADVFSENQIKTDKLAIHSSGGSDLKLNIFCNNLSIESSGGSDITLKGKATNLTLQSSGGSDISAYDLITDYAKIESSGGSDVEVYVNKGLQASASGGSDITFKGNGALRKTSDSKSGSVKHVN
ncbi:head GIN domain-containing protein [Pedobacter sp. UYEF25]